MPALRRSGTGVLETKREEKIYIDKKTAGGYPNVIKLSRTRLT
jgi:hypothetical protein